jgi:hypothetical protein
MPNNNDNFDQEINKQDDMYDAMVQSMLNQIAKLDDHYNTVLKMQTDLAQTEMLTKFIKAAVEYGDASITQFVIDFTKENYNA